MLLSLMMTLMISQAAPLKVVASSAILRDLLQNVGGPEIQVVELEEASRDPHNFDPSIKTIKTLQSSQMSFIVGDQFELWSKALLAPPNYKGSIFKFSEHLDLKEEYHFWMSPDLASKAVDLIEQELARKLPSHAASFKTRAEVYKKEIEKRSVRIKSEFKKINAARAPWVSESEALKLFCQFLGVELLPISRKAHRSETTAKELSEIKKALVGKKAALYVYETHQSQSLAQQRAQDLGLRPAGPLFIETLSNKSQGPQTYLQLLERNSEILLQSLLGIDSN